MLQRRIKPTKAIPLICLGAIALAVSHAAAQTSQPLIKPPEGKPLAAIMTTVQEVYGADLKAAKTPADKLALAEKLIRVGLGEKDNESKFALLCLGRDMGAEAGSLSMAAKAIDGLASTFEIDKSKMRAAAATAAAKSPRSAEAAQSLGLLGEWITAAMAAEQFAAADELAQTATAFARSSGDGILQREATARAASVKEAVTLHGMAKLALATLADKPDDPEANLLVGKYLCFIKGDWTAGVPHLAKSPEGPLKQAAKKDAAGSTDAETDVAIADAWWDQADKATGVAKQQIVARAVKWYSNALPGLTGLMKTKVEKRLKDIEDAAAKLAAAGMRELITKVNGVADKNSDGILLMTQYGNKIVTQESFKPPVAFKIVTQTDSTNVRIAYACDQIIFNWELDQDQLRLDGGPAGGNHKKGAGRIPANTWVTIDLIVTKERMIIKVDGQERQNIAADFSKIDMPITIFPMGSKIAVKSLKVGIP